MSGLADTIARLSRMRSARAEAGPSSGRGLEELIGFGSNPGNLRALLHVPDGIGKGAPLVVVLHGCTQTAASFDAGSGWSQLADQHGFVLLFPEQQRSNNPNLCFNWFAPEDNRRGAGEALSIRQMIDATVTRHTSDPSRVFVTGLSAGGAMAAAMLATYPDSFAGGAIIAGLPYGCATTMAQAFERMGGHGMPTGSALGALVRGASTHGGPWPTISVWHGSGDAVVNPVNARAIVDQWRSLHHLGAKPSRLETVDGYPRRVWCDASGREVIEEYSITGMGHGTPLDTSGEDGCGQAGAYMLEASISSTRQICRFWGLVPGRVADSDIAGAAELSQSSSMEAPLAQPHHAASRDQPSGVTKVIEDALRAAGLMQ